jgi:hypothetical protein
MTASGDGPEGPGVRFLIRSVLRQATLCGSDEHCPDRVYRCNRCGHCAPEELAACPGCGSDWNPVGAVDVSHGPGCPKHLLEEALDTPNGALVRRCFRLLNAKSMGLTITLSDITEEEFRAMELIDVVRQEQISEEDGGAKSFQELLLRKLSRR